MQAFSRLIKSVNLIRNIADIPRRTIFSAQLLSSQASAGPQSKASITEHLPIKCRMLVPSDLDQVEEFWMKYFYPYEGLATLVGLKAPEDAQEYFDQLRPLLIEEDVSFLATLDDQIIAMALSVACIKGKSQFRPVASKNNPRLHRYFQAIEYILQGVDIYELFNIEKFVFNQGIAVHPDFLLRSISEQCIKFGEEALTKERGHGLILMEAAHIRAYKMLQRVGHKTLKTIKFSDMIIDGTPFAGPEAGDYSLVYYSPHGLDVKI